VKKRSQQARIKAPGLFSRVASAVCGKTQRLIQPDEALPLVVATYPRQSRWFANELSDTLNITFPSLPRRITDGYRDALSRVPSVVVADLRAINPCTCLGHHHPAAIHSRLTRSLEADTGGNVGEIDLAVESIRKWNPLPLAGLAASCNDDGPEMFESIRFRAALLAVFLHELEHVAYPERPEEEIRSRSNGFFVDTVSELLGAEFSLASTSPRPTSAQHGQLAHA
jgi:hypothetical protein